MSSQEPILGDLVEMIGVELRIAQILADKAFGASQSPHMASGHYTVLSLIQMNPGINQSALARCMYLDRSTMVPILDQFESKAWIERRKQPEDRRSYALHLTVEGSSALEQSDKAVRELESRIANEMGQENRDQLLALVQQFQGALLTLAEADRSMETNNDIEY